MEQQLKQRLIGVTIIVALIVIFVPLLFDGKDSKPGLSSNGLPPIPDDVVEKPLELPKSPEDVAPKEAETVSESGYKVIPLTDDVPKKPSTAADAKPKAKADASGAEEEPVEVAAEEDESVAPGEVADSSRVQPREEPAKPVVVKPAKPDKAEIAGVQKPAAKPVHDSKKQKSLAPAHDVAPLKKQDGEMETVAGATDGETAIAPTPVKPKPKHSAVRQEAAAKKAEPVKSVDSAAVTVKTEAAPAPKSAQQKPLQPSLQAAKPAATATPSAAKPVADSSGVPAAWVIQTGSFTNESKARSLAEKLRQSKFAAFVETVVGDAGSVYRVQVGPELERGRAEQLQKQIETNVGIKGFIVPHE